MEVEVEVDMGVEMEVDMEVGIEVEVEVDMEVDMGMEMGMDMEVEMERDMEVNKFLLTVYYQLLTTIIHKPINYTPIDFVLKTSENQNISDNKWKYKSVSGNGYGSGYRNG